MPLNATRGRVGRGDIRIMIIRAGVPDYPVAYDAGKVLNAAAVPQESPGSARSGQAAAQHDAGVCRGELVSLLAGEAE